MRHELSALVQNQPGVLAHVSGMLPAERLACFGAVVGLKSWFGYDDSLDAFGIHAVGGVIGAVLTGVFASVAIGGVV